MANEFIQLDYPIHMLQIKLWEWQGIKEQKDVSMFKFGPEQSELDGYNVACLKVKELTEAIEVLNRFNINTYNLPKAK